MTYRFFFKKEEHLTRKIIIQKLFDEGTVIKSYPFRIFILNLDEELQPPVQILITIPKKIFKKAVDRNLLKRRIREAYRINKHLLINELLKKNKCLAIGFVYVENTISDYCKIEDKVKNILSEIGRML